MNLSKLCDSCAEGNLARFETVIKHWASKRNFKCKDSVKDSTNNSTVKVVVIPRGSLSFKLQDSLVSINVLYDSKSYKKTASSPVKLKEVLHSVSKDIRDSVRDSRIALIKSRKIKDSKYPWKAPDLVYAELS